MVIMVNQSSHNLPCKLVLDQETIVSDKDKAHLFAKFLSSVYVERPQDNELTNFIDSRNDRGFFKIIINPDIVHAPLTKMDVKSNIN